MLKMLKELTVQSRCLAKERIKLDKTINAIDSDIHTFAIAMTVDKRLRLD